ncbi:MAG: redoxin domain-containing protein [Sphaerospermopsis sp. SIO1G2]|nr:redoxin domain-containing protein [Sphaerospermopsis sp. SIO1G2]
MRGIIRFMLALFMWCNVAVTGVVASVTERTDITLSQGHIMHALDDAEFDVLLRRSQDRPVFMMVYASWCGHCKRMFRELNALQQQYRERIDIAVISIDNSESLAQNFASDVTPLHLDAYIMKNGASYHNISQRLRDFGLHFKGGISKSIGVPYNTVFYQGEPVAEIAGALYGDRLARLVADIASNTGSTVSK